MANATTTRKTTVTTANNKGCKLATSKEEKAKRKEESAKKLFDALMSNNMLYTTDIINPKTNTPYFCKMSVKVLRNINDYALAFSTVDKNATAIITRANNNGLVIKYVANGARLNAKGGVAAFRIEQINNNKDVNDKVLRNITRGLNFTELLALVLQCAKKDGSNRYPIQDVTDNKALILKYFN